MIWKLGFAIFIFGLVDIGHAQYTENSARFSSSIARNWRVSCQDDQIRKLDPKIERHLGEFIESSIYFGLSRIARVNKNLTNLRLKVYGRRDVLFECKDDLGTNSIAHYNTRKIFKGYRINVLRLAQALAQKNSGQTDVFNGLPFYYASLYSANIILHEYLHHLRFDNYSTEKHNTLSIADSANDIDVVYACASYGAKVLDDPEYQIRSCQTCGMAQAISDHLVEVSTDSNRLHQISEFCRQELAWPF